MSSTNINYTDEQYQY